MLNTGIENDLDVRTALNWFADASVDAAEFWRRVNEASKTYRLAALTLPEKFGKDLCLEELGSDKAASYFTQAAALLQDRQSYDLNLGSKIVPFIKHLGSSIELLEKIPGAKERARRLLCQSSSEPESTIFELAVALRYAKDGFSVQFIPEDPGGKRLPDFCINHEDFFADVECKRLRKSSYEKEEATFQQQIFSSFSKMVNELELSVNVDVIYTQELKTIPVDYLCGWTKKAINCRFLLSDGFPWKDEYGYGRIKPANIDAVRDDTLESSLLFGPKLARLLAEKSVSEGAYNLTVNFKPDPRDTRFIEHIHYGSVATWQCTAGKSVEARARYIKSKLKEVDVQLKSSPLGIVHIAMDAERDKETADLRRSRNMDVFMQFKFESNLFAGCLHYFVSRVTEVSAWMIDETPDRFGRGDLTIAWPGRIFDQAEVLDNDLAAWHQQVPKA